MEWLGPVLEGLVGPYGVIVLLFVALMAFAFDVVEPTRRSRAREAVIQADRDFYRAIALRAALAGERMVSAVTGGT